jgi:adenylate kinase
MVIVVSGTPGTGKTKLAKALAKELEQEYVDVNEIIKSRRLSLGFDHTRKCEIIDPKELSKILIRGIKKNPEQIIDSHLGHYIPKRYVDLCIITTCSLKVLGKRLQKRGYLENKIRENLDSEIFETCRIEAEERGLKIILVDTTTGFDLEGLSKRIRKNICKDTRREMDNKVSRKRPK